MENNAATKAANETIVQHRKKQGGGTWTFLTWAFFISQLVEMVQFEGRAAEISQGESEQALNASSRDNTPTLHETPTSPSFSGIASSDNPPQEIATGSTEFSAPANAALQHSTFSPIGKLNYSQPLRTESVSASPHGQIENMAAEDSLDSTVSQDSISGETVGAVQPVHLLDHLDETVSAVLPPVLEMVGNLVQPIVDVLTPLGTIVEAAAHHTLSQALENVDDVASWGSGTVENVIGSLLPASGHFPVLSPLTTIIDQSDASLLGTLVASVNQGGNEHQGILGTSGQILFKPLPPSGQVNELFSGGAYTDYHLALTSVAVTDPINNETVDDLSGAVGHLLAYGDENQVGNDRSSFSSLSVPDDIAHRGLGDGINL